jgi:hypothetical protein
MVTGALQVLIAKEPAVQVNVTVAAELFQLFALGVGVIVAVTVGGTAGCMFTVTLVEPELPALSVEAPETICPAPRVLTVTGFGHVATPESASVQAKVTVALPKLIPPTGAGETDAVMTGGVLSRLIVALAVAVAPCVSMAVPAMFWLVPSVLTTIGEVQDWIGYEPAVQWKVTVTFELFHPLAFAGGAAVTVMVGRMAEPVSVKLCELSLLAAKPGAAL